MTSTNGKVEKKRAKKKDYLLRGVRLYSSAISSAHDFGALRLPIVARAMPVFGDIICGSGEFSGCLFLP